MKPFILIVYCILATHLKHLQAQSYSSVHYDSKDGLPSATVYSITQDKNGFIWFGTEDGLCRFDGKNFKTFTTKDGLPDNSILKVHADNSGRIYFVPFTHGLYYYENDSFVKFPVPDQYKVDLSSTPAIYNKRNKVVLSGYHDSYIIENNQLFPFALKYNIKPDNTYLERVYDTLIIARTTTHVFFIPDSGRIRQYPVSYKIPLEFDDSARETHLDTDEKYAFYLSEYLPGNLIHLRQNNSLDIYNASTGHLVYKIKADKISDALIDNENNMWVTTLGKGVYRYPSFNFLSMSFDGKSEIFSLLKSGERILAGTDFNKMYNIALKSPPFHYSYSTIDLSAFTIVVGEPVAPAIKRNRIYVLRSGQNNLYIGTDAYFLKQSDGLNLAKGDISPVKDIDILDSKVLVCTGHRVFLLNEQDILARDTLLNQRATCGVIYRGDYYIGTIGGLVKIGSSDKKITELYKLFSPFRERITSLKRGRNDDLWVATSGSGLICFKNDKIVQVLKEENGLTSDICTSLFIDSNLLWLGTDKGLNRIEIGKDKPVITRFTSANGLGADFINTVITTDSNVCVGTAAGLTIFSKKIMTEKSVCLLHILQVSANNKRQKTDSLYSFSYNTLNIQIDFTAISFKSAGDIKYYYRLKGLDKDWNITTANFVNFPTLQPGNYTLYIKAVNKFGIESEMKTIRIDIQPPWWRTWTFQIIALLITGLLVLLIYRYNIRNVKKKEQAKREIEARFAGLEQRALQAQMNPHFVFNALNSIQNFILNLDAEGANTYLTNFASLIRLTLENSMQPMISIASEVKYLETYLTLEKLRFRDKFEYNITVDEAIDQNNTFLPGMLLQPYIENSIRHGIQHLKNNKGSISLSINKTSNNAVLYTINDNGVGRKKAEELKSSRHIEYQSRGTSINEKRIAAINNQFKTNITVKTQDILNDDENGTVTGTSVTILIPPPPQE